MIPFNEWQYTRKKNSHGAEQVTMRDGFGLVLVVSLGEGYEYRHYGTHRYSWEGKEAALNRVKGTNIHMAMNGPLQCSFSEFDGLHETITIAHEYLIGAISWETFLWTFNQGDE